MGVLVGCSPWLSRLRASLSGRVERTYAITIAKCVQQNHANSLEIFMSPVK